MRIDIENPFPTQNLFDTFFMKREIIFHKNYIHAEIFIFLNSSRRDESNHVFHFFIPPFEDYDIPGLKVRFKDVGSNTLPYLYGITRGQRNDGGPKIPVPSRKKNNFAVPVPPVPQNPIPFTFKQLFFIQYLFCRTEDGMGE